MNTQNRLLIPMLFSVLALFAGACSPIVRPPDATTAAAPAATEAPAEEAAPAPTAVAMTGDRPVATVATRSLRVRSAPNAAAEVVAGIAEGETFEVVGISSDGEWVQLAVPGATDGSGWVAANYVTVEGPITDLAITEVTSAAPPTTTTDVAATETVTETAMPAESSPITSTEAMTDVAPAEAAPETTAEITPPAAGLALVVTDGTRLRVRAEPNADAEIVGYIYNGETHEVLETTADGLWVRVAGVEDAVSDNPDGGWVAAEFLVLGQ